MVEEARLSLTLLGSPNLSVDGSIVTIRRRKEIALLAYLAVTQRPHSRDFLAELFYPNHDRDRAYAGLRLLLSLLRKDLGPEWLITNRNNVQFDYTPGAWVDVTALGQEMSQGDDSEHLSEVVQLYSGRFMSGFYLDECMDYENWQDEQARKLERAYAHALTLLIDSNEEDPDATLEYLDRLLSLNPNDENVLRQLMRLYAELNQRPRALERFQEFKARLAREDNTAPEMETDELLTELRNEEMLRRPDHWYNLPDNPTSFVGREKELALLSKKEVIGSAKITTVSGPAGFGKTRLAIQAASVVAPLFANGVVFVNLAVCKNAAEITQAAAEAFAIRLMPGDQREILEIIGDRISGKDILIILDNVEHLLPEGAAEVAAIAEYPGPSVMVTSREPLRIRGEQIVQLDPLALPGADPSEAACESEKLFIDRVLAVRGADSSLEGDGDTIAEICRQVDGVPLALELAAMQTRFLTLGDLLSKMDKQLVVLQGGYRDSESRHMSMKDALNWSYDILTDDQKKLFARLSIFPGGFTADSARGIGSDTKVFFALVETNLLRTNGNLSRHSMLHVVREYAMEKLTEFGQTDIAETRFVQYISGYVEGLEKMLYGQDQLKAIEKIEEEQNNIRAALNMCDQKKWHKTGLTISAALGYFWLRRGKFDEGFRYLRYFCDNPGNLADTVIEAKANYHLGWLCRMVSKRPFATGVDDPASTDAFRKSRDSAIIAQSRRYEALAVTCLGWAEAGRSMLDRHEFLDRGVAMARKTGDPWVISMCLKVGYSYVPRPDISHSKIEKALLQSVELAEATGDPYLICQTTHGMGDVHLLISDHGSAEPWYRRSLAVAREIDDPMSIMMTLIHLCTGYLARNMLEETLESIAEGLTCAAASASTSYIGMFLLMCDDAAIALHNRSAAAYLLGAASKFSVFDVESRQKELFKDPALRARWLEGETISRDEAVDYALNFVISAAKNRLATV